MTKAGLATDHLTHTALGFSLNEVTANCSTIDTATTITTADDDSHGPYQQDRYVGLQSNTLYTIPFELRIV